MTESKCWYFVITTPIQSLSGFRRGEHPLTRSFYENLQKDVSTKLSLASGQVIPREAVIISNVVEISEDVYKTWRD
jgi:hypothetical protein